MPRAFTSADVVQANPGSAAAQITVNPALTNPAVEGRCGLLMMAAGGPINPPELWHTAAGAGAPGTKQVGVFCRAHLADQEQSWQLSHIATGTNWVWLIEEWKNVSYAALADLGSGSAAGVGGVASLSSGNTGTFDDPYVVGIAVAAIINGSGTSPWSAVNWSNSFVETDVVNVGDGTAAGDIQLRVARRYGTFNETGPWETTATWTGGAQTNKTQYVALAVFRAENYAGDI